MRRLLAMFGVMSACFAVLASADEADVMAGYYGNTFEYVGWDGTKYLHINEDLTFDMLHFDNRVFQGKWERRGERVCFMIGEDDSCFDDMMGYAGGQQWQGIHHTGNPYTGIIHKGRISMAELQVREQK